MTYVIIVTYNASKYINACLDSLVQTNAAVVIVDNASSDDTIDLIEAHDRTVTLIKSEENLGFGRGNNLGIKHAMNNGATHVFLLNQDAYLEPGVLDTLTKVMDSNPKYGILSPIHLNGKGDALDRNFARYTSHDKNPSFFRDSLKGKQQNVYDFPFINAAAWLLSAETIKKIGGFDPVFSHYGEDDNYCIRVLYHGLKIGVVPTTFVRHDREDRKEKKIKVLDPSYLSFRERTHKIRLCDIFHDDFELLFSNIMNKAQKNRVKAMLRLKNKEAATYAQEIRMLLSIKSDVIEARERTKKIGMHYI